MPTVMLNLNSGLYFDTIIIWQVVYNAINYFFRLMKSKYALSM